MIHIPSNPFSAPFGARSAVPTSKAYPDTRLRRTDAVRDGVIGHMSGLHRACLDNVPRTQDKMPSDRAHIMSHGFEVIDTVSKRKHTLLSCQGDRTLTKSE